MRIESKLQEVLCANPKRSPNRSSTGDPLEYCIDTIIVHRFGWNSKKDWLSHTAGKPCAASVAKFFHHLNGWAMPYHFTVTESKTEQAVQIYKSTPHAYKLNGSAIGVAMLGDFRVMDPHPMLIENTVELLGLLSLKFPDALITPHSPGLPGATTDPGKECPGDQIDFADLLERVEISKQVEVDFLPAGQGILV